MESGICLLALAPLRALPDHRSEMTSQLLFGEMYEILEKEKKWIRIKCLYDGYEGWLDAKQTEILNDEESERIQKSDLYVASDPVQLVFSRHRSLSFPLLAGSSLPGISGKNLLINHEHYEYEGDYETFSPVVDGQLIVETAYQFMHTPYLWGGRSPFGIDCSGFTQVVYKICGIPVARDAAQQITQGDAVDFIGEALPGDLAFFENEEGNIVHTGIMISSSRIIHASAYVKTDHIDHEGIFDTKRNHYSHKLRMIRRFVHTS